MKSLRNGSQSHIFKLKSNKLIVCLMTLLFAFQPFLTNFPYAFAENNLTLENEKYRMKIGNKGEIFSLKLPNDLFDTEYFMNSQNSKFLNPMLSFQKMVFPND